MHQSKKKLQAGSFISWAFLIIIASYEASMENRITEKIENSLYFSRVTTRIEYHKKRANGQIIFKLEFKSDGNGEEYKVEVISNSTDYGKESESGHLPGLYYLVSFKNYLEEENTCEPVSDVKHLTHCLVSFIIRIQKKLTATSTLIDSVSLMA